MKAIPKKKKNYIGNGSRKQEKKTKVQSLESNTWFNPLYIYIYIYICILFYFLF